MKITSLPITTHPGGSIVPNIAAFSRTVPAFKLVAAAWHSTKSKIGTWQSPKDCSTYPYPLFAPEELEHLNLFWYEQIRPVVAVHAFGPHLQGFEFGVMPPLSLHCAFGPYASTKFDAKSNNIIEANMNLDSRDK